MLLGCCCAAALRAVLVVRVRYLVCQLFHTLILECIVGYAGDNDGDGGRELKQHIYM